jgi:hypothetical protein
MMSRARDILLAELEINTPFHADAIHWDWFQRGEGTEPGTLALTQVVLKRRDADAIRQALAEAEISVAGIAVESTDGPSSGAARLPLDLQRNDMAGPDFAAQGLGKARRIVIGAAVLTSLAVVPTAFYQQSNVNAALDAAISDARDAVSAHPGLGRTQLKELGDALAVKRDSPSITQILDALAAGMPQDSYLEHAFLDKDVLTIQGKTGSSAALEHALSASPLFSVGHNTASASGSQGPAPFTIRLKVKPNSPASGA